MYSYFDSAHLGLLMVDATLEYPRTIGVVADWDKPS